MADLCVRAKDQAQAPHKRTARCMDRQDYFDWAKQVADQIPDPSPQLLSLFKAVYDRRP